MRIPELTSLQIFRGLDDRDATAIRDSMQQLQYEADETILSEGLGPQALWIILSGECIVSRSCSAIDERVLARLKAGDVFGEMSFVRSAPHSATIKAVTQVTVCSYHRHDFQKLIEQRPEAALRVTANIAAVLAERLRRMDTWVCELVDGPTGQQHRDEWQNFRSAVYTNWNL